MTNCFAVTVVIVPYMSTSSLLFDKARDEVKCFKKTLFIMNMHFRKDEVYSKTILKTINVYILMLEESLTGVYKM